MPRTRVLSILTAVALLGATAPAALADPLEQRGGRSHGGHQGPSVGGSAAGRPAPAQPAQQAPTTGRRFESPAAGPSVNLPAAAVTTANPPAAPVVTTA